jgi:hypothetical protein
MFGSLVVTFTSNAAYDSASDGDVVQLVLGERQGVGVAAEGRGGDGGVDAAVPRRAGGDVTVEVEVDRVGAGRPRRQVERLCLGQVRGVRRAVVAARVGHRRGLFHVEQAVVGVDLQAVVGEQFVLQLGDRHVVQCSDVVELIAEDSDGLAARCGVTRVEGGRGRRRDRGVGAGDGNDQAAQQQAEGGPARQAPSPTLVRSADASQILHAPSLALEADACRAPL